MRRLIVFSDISIDGFMAGPDNDLGFVVDDPELEDEFPGRLRAVADLIIFGRKSFDGTAAYWTTAQGPLADWMNSTPKIILSTQSGHNVSAWPNATLTPGDGTQQVRRIKEETAGGSIVAFGGVQTVRSLVTAGLVDEYWLKINPTITGRGGSMFTGVEQFRTLTLLEAKTYPSGTIAAIYTTHPR